MAERLSEAEIEAIDFNWVGPETFNRIIADLRAERAETARLRALLAETIADLEACRDWLAEKQASGRWLIGGVVERARAALTEVPGD